MPLTQQIQQFPIGDEPPAAIDNGQEIPKEMDIFFQSEESFLPPGKTFDDLTEAEKKALQAKYRFSPFKPGLYEGITGIVPGDKPDLGDISVP